MSGIIKKLPPATPATVGTADEVFWSDCRRLVDEGAVTPIISNQVTAMLFNVEPGDLAQAWAEDIQSPFSPLENRDIAHVAQYYSVHVKGPVEAKRQYLEKLKEYLIATVKDDTDADADLVADYLNPEQRKLVSLSEMARLFGYPRYADVASNPLRLLAEMPLPIYLTTSHHQFLQHALVQTGHKQPVTEVFRWHDGLRRIPSIFDREPDYVPSVERPLVYHLFGLDEYSESLVLTEDDFLDYLVKLSALNYEVKHADKQEDIPAVVSTALTGTALLLLGYEVYDWEFRVLFKGLVQATGESRRKRTPKSIAMQIDPKPSDNGNGGSAAASDRSQEARIKEIKVYLRQFFEQAHFNVYWGDMKTCVCKFWQLWNGEQNGHEQ